MRTIILPLCLSTLSSSAVLRMTLYPDSLPSLEYVQKRQVPAVLGSVPRPPGIPPFNVPPPPFPPPFLQPRLKNNYRTSPAYKLGYAAGNGIHRSKKSMADAVKIFKAQQPTWRWSRQPASFRPTVEVSEPDFVPSPVDTNLNSLSSLLPQTDLGLRKPKALVSSTASKGNGILVIPFEKTPITHAVHGSNRGTVNLGGKIKTNEPLKNIRPILIPHEEDSSNVKASIKVTEVETTPVNTVFDLNLITDVVIKDVGQSQTDAKPPPKVPEDKAKPSRTVFGSKVKPVKAKLKVRPSAVQGMKNHVKVIKPPGTPQGGAVFSLMQHKHQRGKNKKTAPIIRPSSGEEGKAEVLIEVHPPSKGSSNSGAYDPFEFKGLQQGLNDFTKGSFGPESEEFDMNVGLEMVEAAIEGLKRGLGHGSTNLNQGDESIETEIGIDMVEEAIESIQPQTQRTARGKQQILQRIKKLKREGKFPWRVQEQYSDANGANYKFVIVADDSTRRRRKVDRSDRVLPPGAVQAFVRGLSTLQFGNNDKFETSRNSRFGDDNDDKSQGVEVGRLDAGDEWLGKERVSPPFESGNSLSQESAAANKYLASSDEADGFSERDSHTRQEDIMIMQESNEEPTMFESQKLRKSLDLETEAPFDIDRQDNRIDDVSYEDRNSPKVLSIYDDIEESLERMNSPSFRTALSIYDILEDSSETILDEETFNHVKANESFTIASDLTETRKTEVPSQLQSYGRKLIDKNLVRTIDGDLETENSDRQEIRALPLVGTDPNAEQIDNTPSTDTEPSQLPDLVKAKGAINQLSKEAASESSVTDSTSEGPDNSHGGASTNRENQPELHPSRSVGSGDFSTVVANHKKEALEHLQSEALVFASESEPLFHWEDSLYGRNKIHADLDHPLEILY